MHFVPLLDARIREAKPSFSAIAEWALCDTQQLEFFPYAQSDDKPLSHLNAEQVG
jgi:hypothetical protein